LDRGTFCSQLGARGESWTRRFVVSLAAVTSALVAVVGVVFHITPRAAAMCVIENYRYEPLCWYSAEYSNLLAPYWDRIPVHWHEIVFVAAVALMSGSLVVSGLLPGLSQQLHRFGRWFTGFTSDEGPSESEGV
jgi:hypothetical protein